MRRVAGCAAAEAWRRPPQASYTYYGYDHHLPCMRGDNHHHRPERCAITTRVATSFLRVGHFELYARRARRGEATGLQALRRPFYTYRLLLTDD